MRRIVPLALAAAVVGLAATTAQAAFTVTVTEQTLNANLTAAGWAGYLITITGEAGAKILTVDANNAIPDKGAPLAGGIYGPVLQRWVLDSTTNSDGTVVTQKTPISNGANPPGQAARNDSLFLNGGYFPKITDSPNEDNNGTNAGTGTNDVPAVADADNGIFTNGSDFGIGSFMRFTAAAQDSTSAVSTLNLAFVVAKKDAGDVKFNAVVIDPDQNFTAFQNISVNGPGGPPIPEPASLGVLALGGLSLLARRRRSA
jgi:hypothetical protein